MSTIILEALLAYLINLASNERSSAIAARRERDLEEALEKERNLIVALSSRRSFRDELRLACVALARNRLQFGATSEEAALWNLLGDDIFQSELAEWFMAGGIEEGAAARDRLLQTIVSALSSAGASSAQIAFLRTDYLNSLERIIYRRARYWICWRRFERIFLMSAPSVCDSRRNS